MKTILLVMGLVLSLQCLSQNDSTYQAAAGKHLVDFRQAFYIGLTTSLIGSGLMILSGQADDGTNLLYAGGVIGTLGAAITLYGFTYIGKAGKSLMRVNLNSSGIALCYRF